MSERGNRRHGDRRELDEIKALLAARSLDLAQRLAPGGRRNGRYYKALSPLRPDGSVGSFWVTVSGPLAGTWKDAATGQFGDLLALAARVHGTDFRGALAWARDELGLSRMDETRRREMAAQAQRLLAERAQQAAAASAADAGQRKRALACVLAARQQPWAMSPADLYLRGRGIDFGFLGRRPSMLGWLPPDTTWSRHVETGTRCPVMVAAILDDGGHVIAHHRTFLQRCARHGWDKIDAKPPRKVWPAGISGGVIRLWRGSSAMSVGEAAAAGLREALVLCEGVEDGLSIAMGRPDLRIWAAVSLGNIAHVRVPECIDEVIVAADNDWGKPQAQRQLQFGIDALLAQGVQVSVARSPVGKDANDALRGRTEA